MKSVFFLFSLFLGISLNAMPALASGTTDSQAAKNTVSQSSKENASAAEASANNSGKDDSDYSNNEKEGQSGQYTEQDTLSDSRTEEENDSDASINENGTEKQSEPEQDDWKQDAENPQQEQASMPNEDEPLSEEDSDSIGNGPWETGAIEVRGNKNLKAKVLIKTGKAKKGKLYKKSDISADIEAMMSLGSLENISVEIEPIKELSVSKKNAEEVSCPFPVKIIYVIEEKPAIKKINIIGRKRMSAGTIRDAMNTKEKDFLDDFRLREDMLKIIEKYNDRGFIDAKATYEKTCDEQTRLCSIDINITEGPKAIIDSVSFSGVTAFKEKKLRKKLQNRPKRKYNPKQIKADLAALSAFYKDNGYADFEINDSSITFNENRSSVTFHISLTEGEVQYFGATFFSGNEIYMPGDFKTDIAYKRGKKYSQELFTETILAIQNKYADKGYLKADISYDRTKNEKTGETDITFFITEHNPIYVGHIDIAGNEATKPYVFRREVAQKEGEVFSSAKVRRSQEKIFNLGFIDDVKLAINPTEEPDKVDLVFDVTEGKPGMLTAGAGISSSDGFVGTLSLTHLNLFGRAYRTSLSYNFGKNIQDYNFSISTPWLGEKPIRLGLDTYNTRHYKPYQTTLHAYTEKRTGGRISVTPRFEDDKYYITAAYSLERIRMYDIDNAYADVLKDEENITSTVFLEAAIDTRDSIWDPTRGQKLSLGIEYAGGIFQGDMNFYKPTLSYSFNQKLFSIGEYPFVLAVSNRIGFAERFGDTKEVPVYERYFLGGADTIRGYKNNGQVGPANGGLVYDVMNVEFKFPLAREKRRTIVQWAFFFDIGNSWNKFDEISLRTGRGEKQLKSGAGFGIRFTTPAFPIRLDWGYGFNHNRGDDLSDIYFTMGTMF